MEENEERTLYENLEYLNETKGIIKQAIIDKGVEISADTPFREYADKISNITTGEDLEAELSAQEQVIQEMEIALENKIASGKNASLNVFVQEAEPSTKDGIWIKANKTLEHIIEDDDYYIENKWETAGRYSNIPFTFKVGTVVNNGKDVYIFYGTTAYKYDIELNVYEQLSNPPTSITGNSNSGVYYNNYIYLFGSSTANCDKIAYKYDIENDTYIRLSDIPSSHKDGGACLIDNYIWLLAESHSSIAYKYDIENDTYITYNFYSTSGYQYMTYASFVPVGKRIYRIGSNSSPGDNYVKYYDTETNTWSSMLATCLASQSTSVLVGDYIYTFGFYAGAKKYNLLTNTWSDVTSVPTASYNGRAIYYNNKIYIFGGRSVYNTDSYHNKVQCLPLSTKTYENNTAVIVQGIYYSSSYLVKLLDVESPLVSENQYLKYAFKKALFYDETDGLQDTLPVYYGNGTKWTQI